MERRRIFTLPAKLQALFLLLNELDNEERLIIFDCYCTSCGGGELPCCDDNNRPNGENGEYMDDEAMKVPEKLRPKTQLSDHDMVVMYNRLLDSNRYFLNEINTLKGKIK